ncbi:MAG: hypothetical protein ABI726_09595 [bacterium]
MDAAGTKELGKTANTPRASCPTPKGNDYPPRKGCQALGEVTGFQKTADGKKHVFKVPSKGTIVGWRLALSKPNKRERSFFEKVLGNETAGGAPTARLALLSKGSGKKYRLRAQSPRMKLGSVLGHPETFTLNNPIPVKEGWTVALTTPTWVPSFAHDLGGKGDSWRASRTKKRCDGAKNLQDRSKPHKGVGTNRVYACSYKQARLLYWAYFLPD